MRRFIALTLTLGFLVSGCGTSTEADSPPTTPNGTASCGDSVCDESESCETCPEDCGDCEDGPNFCGDFVCDDEEDCVSCPEDCGDCFSEITCGDDICSETESCSTCPEDCGQCIESHCGDGQCSGIETCDTCPADCGPCKTSCGDGSCQEDENCLSCSADCGSCAPGHLDIWSPRPIAPQFAVAGGAIQAEVNGKDTWNPNEWYAVVRNTYRTWPCKVTAKYGSIDYGRRKGWILDIQLPIYVPPELLELAIAHGEAGTGSRIRSVQMVASFDEDFYIIHQTDHHIAAKNAKRPDGTVDLGGGPKPGTSQALTWGAKAINIINPRFVMLTGDNIFVIFEDKNSWRGLKRSVEILNYFKEGINTYQVATLVTSGNHDVGTNIHTTPDQLKYLEEYANILGPRSFSRRMGPFYIGLFEWSRSQFTEAMTKDYNASFQDPLVQFRLVGSHFNSGKTQIPSKNHPANLQLIGHHHEHKCIVVDNKTVFSPTVMGPQARTYQRSRMIRFKHTNKGWTSPLITDCAHNVKLYDLHGKDGAEKLSESFKNPNNGSHTSNQVTITNRLDFNFNRGRTTFVMKKGKYRVTGGEPEAVYDSQDGSKTIVLVRVNIPRKTTSGPGKVVVSIEPDPSSP